MSHMSPRIQAWPILLIICAATPVMAAEFEASVAWARKVALSVPVSGLVASVEVMPGQAVSKDQKLLQLDQDPFTTALKKAKATVNRQRVILKAARRDRDQAQELYDRAVSATLELDVAKENYQRAVADLQVAEAALKKAEYKLNHSTLKAPFDGLVISRHAEPGQLVVNTTTSTTLIVLVARGEYVARTLLGANQMDGVEMGKQVKVVVRKKTLPGRITALGLEPARNKEKKRYDVEVSFVTDILLRAGETVEVEVD